MPEGVSDSWFRRYDVNRNGLLCSEEFFNLCRDYFDRLRRDCFPDTLRVSPKIFVRQNRRRLEAVYTVGKKLGEGSFGQVFKVAHNISGQERVCKKISKSKAGMSIPDILREIQNMAE